MTKNRREALVQNAAPGLKVRRGIAVPSGRAATFCFSFACRRRLGRPRDGKDLAHMSRKRAAEFVCRPRNGPPRIADDGIGLPQRLFPVFQAGHLHVVAMGRKHRRDDRNSLPGLCERQQRVRRRAFKRDVGFELGDTAGRIERAPDREAPSQQKHRVRPQLPHVHALPASDVRRRIAHRDKLERRKPRDVEPPTARFERSAGRDDDVSFATLQQREQFASESLVEPDLNLRTMLCVAGQKD